MSTTDTLVGNKLPTGIALHQWKRGREFRQIIKAPEGFHLVEFDFSGQEYRWMGVQSGDENILHMCQPGEDGHSFFASKLLNQDYAEFQAWYATGDEKADLMRKAGKVGNLSCIAEDQQVLTDRGYVPIQHVTMGDKVWDGLEWVEHGGVVCNGVREVIQYEGVTATPDHRVLVGDTWVEIQHARDQAYTIQSVKWCPPAGLGYRESRSAVAVYDILNAGPRNRFTVNGKIVHNCQYRTSAKRVRSVARVQYGLPMTHAEADTVHATYRSTYPRVPLYWKSSVQKARRNGYAETSAGRRITLRGDWWGKDQWKLESTAINYPIQGTGGDQKYLALAIIQNYVHQAGGRFYYELHDGLFFILPKDNKIKTHLTHMHGVLGNLPYKRAWGEAPPIDFPVDGAIGPDWGNMISMEEFIDE